MTHTKGPWRVNGRRIESGPIVAGDGGAVATLHRDLSDGHIEANARLIALAPEMADLLDLLVKADGERIARDGGTPLPGIYTARYLLARLAGTKAEAERWPR